MLMEIECCQEFFAGVQQPLKYCSRDFDEEAEELRDTAVVDAKCFEVVLRRMKVFGRGSGWLVANGNGQVSKPSKPNITTL